MRASTNKDDPGYHNFVNSLAGGGLVAYCDGELIPSPITADEEEGFVIAHRLDAAGQPQLDESGCKVDTITHRGAVEIKPRVHQS